jgi:tetratricopeptide (TPR) repeat protein
VPGRSSAGTPAELMRASTMIDIGRYDDAAGMLARIVAAAPDSARAWCLMSRAQLGRGENDEALRAAGRAISLNPADDWPHRLASTALVSEGRSAEAVTAAQQARRLGPQLWQSHVCLAQAAAAARRLDVAVEAATAALALAPDQPDVHVAAGKVSLARQDLAAARSHQERALAIDPGHTGAMNELGRISLKGRDSAAAARYFMRAARSAPGIGVFGRNAEIALLRVVTQIIYVSSIAAALAIYLPMVLRVGWLSCTIVRTVVGVAVICYAFRQLRRLPAEARRHLGRMLRRPRTAVAISLAMLTGSRLLPSATLRRAERRRWPPRLRPRTPGTRAGRRGSPRAGSGDARGNNKSR